MARALAVIGMILVNYKRAMNAQSAEPEWLQMATGAFEGRASVLFVVLAGIGVSLMTAKVRTTEDEYVAVRHINSSNVYNLSDFFIGCFGGNFHYAY
ncbi:hypothetical protein MH215_22860 [Paenibacillus sp. ACRSA]|uniref:hypothetical protein n=1 Tax=Paenibacillus sp. ACRSA TaxID=2918211 RepID=UPI001EF5A32C|nr:hypothetical protein [Paenibacillus sp. ACRSA]MCG7379846.1 hypothetical protein [Paenibacillus sp. ACRSA]